MRMFLQRITALALSTALLVGCMEGSSEGTSSDTGGVGQGGSTATFTIQSDFLLVLAGDELLVFELGELDSFSEPEVIFSENLWGKEPETVFPYGEDTVLIGAQAGMYIYEIDAIGNLQQRGFISHARACDPVVAENDYAYVTLNADAQCNFGGDSELLSIDISDLSEPVQRDSYDLSAPKGLAVSGEALFVCDQHRLVEFNVSEPASLEVVDNPKHNQIQCNDVLIRDELLYVTGDGVAIYDFAGQLVAKLPTGE